MGLGYKQMSDLPITVVRTPQNLGYGGNQKLGYQWAIENDLDVVVLLHGDGQYAPEFLPQLVAPLEDDSADAVFGSRMLEPGRARQGGMPLYKYLGNQVLSKVENTVAGANLSEWHSGYRAYSTKALASIPFERNDDGFNFDTQIIVQLLETGMRIAEVAIPTYYGDEICYVNGMSYAKDITRDVLRYRLHKMGFGSGETAFASSAYEEKHGEESSHAKIERWTAQMPPSAGARPRFLRRRPGRPAAGPGPRGDGRGPRGPPLHRGPRRPLHPGRPRPRHPRGRWVTATTSSSPPTCSSTCATPTRCWPTPTASCAPVAG